MNVETLLPLGKADPGLRAAETPQDISRVAADARLVEQIGYDGLVTEESRVLNSGQINRRQRPPDQNGRAASQQLKLKGASGIDATAYYSDDLFNERPQI